MSHMDETPSHIIAAFGRFLKHLPHNADRRLIILQAHLLIEEQIKQIIAGRIKNPSALKDADLESAQLIGLAQAFFEADHMPVVWKAVRKLNGIRNDVAHNVEQKGLSDKIENFIQFWPSGVIDGADEDTRLGLTLWSLFIAVAELVERPSAQIVEVLKAR